MAIAAAAQQGSDALRAQDLTRYVGKYQLRGYVIQIVVDQGVLSLVVPGAPFQRLRRLGPNQFKSETFENETFTFKEENERIAGLVSRRPGHSMKFKRISDAADDFSSGDSILNNKKLTPHFSFSFTEQDVAFVDTISRSLEKDYVKIKKDFRLDSLPVICVKIYPDRRSFNTGINYPAAPDHVLATAFGKDDIRIMSPIGMGDDSVMMVKGMLHEFVHCVHLNIDYSPNNPRWLWEGLAQFESNWFFDPSEIDEIRKRKFPRLARLGGGQEYTLGYALIEAITDLWGFDVVIELVKKRGDVNAVLGLSQKQFETSVFNHIYTKYVEKK